MLNEFIIFLIIVLFIVREYFHLKEIESLLKMVHKQNMPVDKAQPNQMVVEEENQISIDDPDFDIKKINKVITNGQQVPITIQ